MNVITSSTDSQMGLCLLGECRFVVGYPNECFYLGVFFNKNIPVIIMRKYLNNINLPRSGVILKHVDSGCQ